MMKSFTLGISNLFIGIRTIVFQNLDYDYKIKKIKNKYLQKIKRKILHGVVYFLMTPFYFCHSFFKACFFSSEYLY